MYFLLVSFHVMSLTAICCLIRFVFTYFCNVYFEFALISSKMLFSYRALNTDVFLSKVKRILPTGPHRDPNINQKHQKFGLPKIPY